MPSPPSDPHAMRPSGLARALLPLCALAAALALAAPACGGGDDDDNAANAGRSGTGGSGGSAGAPPSKGPVTEGCPTDSELTYENFGAPFLLSWCNGCHSSSLPEDSRQKAPLGIDFDTIDKVRAHSARISARGAGDAPSMPPSGGPPEADRQKLAEWLACGAPSTGKFTALPEDSPSGAGGAGGSTLPPACAALGKPVTQLPRCKAETKTCLEACADKADPEKDACEQECQKAEPAPTDGGPSCSDCLFLQGIAYAEQNGCAPLVSEGFCCIITQCPTFDPTCFRQKCAVETESMFYCMAYVTPEAFSSNPMHDACFAAP